MIVSVKFTKNSGQPATGLTLSEIEITLVAVNKLTLVETTLWSAVAPTDEINLVGAYAKLYSGEDFSTYFYYATATYTGATALDSDYAHGITGENLNAAAVWSYGTRVLTVPSAIVNESAIGNQVSVYRGTKWEIAFSTSLDLSGYTDFWFTIKVNTSDLDSRALVHISQSVGLEVINKGVAATAANGSIVDTDAGGVVTVSLEEAETALLLPGRRYNYDLKGLNGSGDTVMLVDGRELINILPDVSRAIS